MKPPSVIPYAGLILFLVIVGQLQTVVAQNTIATTPVGFLSVPVPPSPDGINQSSVTISVPFYGRITCAGRITSVDGPTSFSSGTASWTANQFATTPTLAKIMSGSNTGRFFLITANTATQMTVDAQGYDLRQLLAENDQFEVFPANTLGSLFGTSSVQFKTGSSANNAGDNLYLWDVSSQTWDVYYNNGSHWRKAASLQDQDNTILYPDVAIFVLRTGTTPLSLTFTGRVPETTERTDLPGPSSTFIANRFPADTLVKALGIQLLSGWQIGSSASGAGDNLYIWNGSAWGVYYYNGTNWKKTGSFSIQDNTAISAGSAVLVSRVSTATGTASTLVQNLPYNLNQ